MNKTIAFHLLFINLFCFCFISSCKKDDEHETKISMHNSNESHNPGQNCMNCHRNGGEGEGIFTVAGTVYDSTGTARVPNGTIRLYSQPNSGSNIIATIEVDARGNFYTTESIDLSNGVYGSATSTGGITHFMPDINTNGACNSCHGVSEAYIWTE